MNIVVCIKQVPDVDDIKWTKENNLDRTQMLSKINPSDEWALDYALKIKSILKNVQITAISMGPKNADETLKYALAKGATRAILLSDKLFAGSDTLITAKILSGAIKKYIPDFDLIITGQFASDGDTQQVPVSISQELQIIDVEQVIEIYNADKSNVMVAQKLDNEINILEVKTPCLIAVNKEREEKYIPKIDDYIRAQNSIIEEYGAQDLGIEQSGVITSPTIVHKAFRPNFERIPKEITGNVAKSLVNIILKANK